MAMDAPRKRCTCFLLRKLPRRVTQAYDQALAPAGLTITQYSLLAHLARGEGASVSALAGRMGMERTTLVRNLKPLVAAGWARYGEPRPGQPRAPRPHPARPAPPRRPPAPWGRAQDALEAQLGAKSVAALHALVDQSLETLSHGEAA